MKIVKRILLGIAALIAIVLITALFVKKDYSAEREIVINKPKAAVFDYVSHLKNLTRYNTFAQKDPNMRSSFKGIDATVGFIYTWEGNSDAGKGEQEIKNIIPGERVDLDLRFIKPMEGKADAFMSTEAIDAASTKVKWGFKSSIPYPFNAIRIFVNMEKMMGKELEASLQNMKADIEK